MWGIWAFGLLPIFDDLRWIPSWSSVIVGVVLVFGTIMWFGFWGTVSTLGRGHGEEYGETFPPWTALGLGWLRWLMQIVLVAVVLIPGVFIWLDVRAWHVLGTDELRSLPDDAAAIPVPDDWALVSTRSTDVGLSGIADWTDGRHPNGRVTQTFEVPPTYTFDDLKEWFESDAWIDTSDGEAFGAIEIEGCRAEQMRCAARRTPPPGEHPEYFVSAILELPVSEWDEPEVEVHLSYEKYSRPDWDISDETVDRAMAIPVPSGWVRDSDALASTTNNGETFSQGFGVPESTTREDIEAWLAGSEWTAPSAGEPFGELEEANCREIGTGELDRTYLCSVIVVRDDPADRPIESFTVSLDSDHQVRISLSRNG